MLLIELGGEQADALRPDLERLGYTAIAELLDEDDDVRGLEARFGDGTATGGTTGGTTAAAT
jgi:hypothetical protein